MTIAKDKRSKRTGSERNFTRKGGLLISGEEYEVRGVLKRRRAGI